MPQLTKAQRVEIIVLRKTNHRVTAIAQKLGITKRTVYKWLERFENEGSLERTRRVKFARGPRKIQDCAIVKAHSSNGLRRTAVTAKKYSVPTTDEDSSSAPAKVKRPKKKPKLSMPSSDSPGGSRTGGVSDNPLCNADNGHRTLLAEETGIGSDLIHEQCYCNGCSNIIRGFRYVCVQCTDVNICSTCEARAVHGLHYMLRVPGPRPEEEILSILQKIREELCKYQNKITSTVQSIKIEMAEAPDPMDVVENVYVDAPVSMDNRLIKGESKLTYSETTVQDQLAISKKRRLETEQFNTFEDQNLSYATMTSDSTAQNTENLFNNDPKIKDKVDVSDKPRFVHEGVDPPFSGLISVVSGSCAPREDHIVPIFPARTSDVLLTHACPVGSMETPETTIASQPFSNHCATSDMQLNFPCVEAGGQFLNVTGRDTGQNEHKLPYQQ